MIRLLRSMSNKSLKTKMAAQQALPAKKAEEQRRESVPNVNLPPQKSERIEPEKVAVNATQNLAGETAQEAADEFEVVVVDSESDCDSEEAETHLEEPVPNTTRDSTLSRRSSNQPASPPLLDLRFVTDATSFNLGSPIVIPQNLASNMKSNPFEQFIKDNLMNKPAGSLSAALLDPPLSPIVKSKRTNPHNKANTTRAGLQMTPHQIRMAETVWSETLVNDKLFRGLEAGDAEKVLSAFHDDCLVIIATPEVTSLGMMAKCLMLYGWQEMENWVKETIASKHKFTLDCKVTGSQFWSDNGDLELETKDGIFSGCLNVVLEDYLIKSLTLTFSEFDQN